MGKDFKYNGYTFRPLGDKNMSFEAACRRISSDRELGMSTYEWSKGEKYNYEAFYKASGNSQSDLFLCLENGKVYIPIVMYISELNREQLIELKQSYLIQQNEETGEGTSYDELARADSIISDKVIQEVYSGINFTEDDFPS